MGADRELVTIFRSMDSSASDEANEISGLLANAGLDPVVLDDSALGVPSGAFVVKVPEDQAVRADEVLENAEEVEPDPGDPSHSMDPRSNRNIADCEVVCLMRTTCGSSQRTVTPFSRRRTKLAVRPPWRLSTGKCFFNQKHLTGPSAIDHATPGNYAGLVAGQVTP